MFFPPVCSKGSNQEDEQSEEQERSQVGESLTITVQTKVLGYLAMTQVFWCGILF